MGEDLRTTAVMANWRYLPVVRSVLESSALVSVVLSLYDLPDLADDRLLKHIPNGTYRRRIEMGGSFCVPAKRTASSGTLGEPSPNYCRRQLCPAICRPGVRLTRHQQYGATDRMSKRSRPQEASTWRCRSFVQPACRCDRHDRTRRSDSAAHLRSRGCIISTVALVGGRLSSSERRVEWQRPTGKTGTYLVGRSLW